MGVNKSKIQFNKLKNRYRLIIRNDNSLAERLSIVLTPLNLMAILGGLLLVYGLLIGLLIVKTPISRMFFNSNFNQLQQDNKDLAKKVEDLSYQLKILKQKEKTLNEILKETNYKKTMSNKLIFRFSKHENDNEFKDAPKNTDFRYLNFFAPVSGKVSSHFNPKEKHFGTDIITSKNKAIRATLSGTVVFSAWTPQNGNVILLQHPNNMISVYEHNAILFKKEGDFVNAGDPIAIVGNSGELSSGPHLHFELWYRGSPVDPINFININ